VSKHRNIGISLDSYRPVLLCAAVLSAWDREHSCLGEINRSAVDFPMLGATSNKCAADG